MTAESLSSPERVRQYAHPIPFLIEPWVLPDQVSRGPVKRFVATTNIRPGQSTNVDRVAKYVKVIGEVDPLAFTASLVNMRGKEGDVLQGVPEEEIRLMLEISAKWSISRIAMDDGIAASYLRWKPNTTVSTQSSVSTDLSEQGITPDEAIQQRLAFIDQLNMELEESL